MIYTLLFQADPDDPGSQQSQLCWWFGACHPAVTPRHAHISPPCHSQVSPSSPRNVLVEEVAAREFPCGLHGVPANGTVIVIDCQLLRCCNCKPTKKKKEETGVMITPAQRGLLARESRTEKTFSSTLTFPWERCASRFAVSSITQTHTAKTQTHIPPRTSYRHFKIFFLLHSSASIVDSKSFVLVSLKKYDH